MGAGFEQPEAEPSRPSLVGPSFEFPPNLDPEVEVQLQADANWLFSNPQANLRRIIELRSNPKLADEEKELARLLDPANKYAFDDLTETEITHNRDVTTTAAYYRGATGTYSMVAIRLARLEVVLKRLHRLQKIAGTAIRTTE